MSQTHGGGPAKGLWRTIATVLESLGAALIFGAIVASFIVAALAFDPKNGLTREQASAFNPRVFHALLGMQGVGMFLVFFGVAFRRARMSAARLGMLVVLGFFTIWQEEASAVMGSLQEEAAARGGIGALAADDPTRAEFGRLHGHYAIAAVGAVLLSAALLAVKARSEE